MQKVCVVDLSPEEQTELLGWLGENEVEARKIKLTHILLRPMRATPMSRLL